MGRLRMVLFFVTFIFLCSLSPQKALANYTFFEDNFSGVDDIKWSFFQNGGSINLHDDGYISLENADTRTFPYAYTNHNPFPESGNFELEVRFRFRNTTFWGNGLIFAFEPMPNGSNLSDSATNNYFQIWNESSNHLGVWVYKCPLSLDCAIREKVYSELPNDNWHVFKINYTDEKYYLYFDGNEVFVSENTQLVLRSIILGGDPRTFNHPVTRASLDIDYIRITSEEVSQDDFLDVINYKQYDPTWKDQEYDHASGWLGTTIETIERWGCALTSAAMVLDYHGWGVDPSTLNDWLRAQTDGFIRNGLVNWLAISRYTRKNGPANGFEALEYRRHGGFDTAKLDAELEALRPAILSVPGHFVVAKGTTNDSYAINDPAYADRISLASYGDHFDALGSYVPSNTDLSYIMLVVNPEIEVEIRDLEGNVVETEEYIQEPIDDPFSDEVSGEVVKIVLVPKPEETEYQLFLAGEGEYSLDWYWYNQEGEVDQGMVEGEIDQDKDVFLVSIEDGVMGIDSLEELVDLLQLKLSDKNGKQYNTLKVKLNLIETKLARGKSFPAEVLLRVFYMQTKVFPKIDRDLASELRGLIELYWSI